MLQFLACDHLPRPFEQSQQDLKRLLLKPDADTLPAQNARLRLHLENPEADDRARQRLSHRRPLWPDRRITPASPKLKRVLWRPIARTSLFFNRLPGDAGLRCQDADLPRCEWRSE